MVRDINWNQKQRGVFFPIQQWSCHNNIVADKGLNLFDECAAECVHLCHQEEECTSSALGDSEMYIAGTIANSQTDRGCQLK